MHSTHARAHTLALILGVTVLTGNNAAADFVINDDLIVQGSTCTGLDCVNNEAFGFDTLILKENNLRIFFNDTSVVGGGFPANKWRITINDSANGGASFFAIDDVTANRAGVFKIMAGAPSASLFVAASSGNVGVGTTVPGLDINIFSGDTPAIRLEQSGSGGFTAQTWDIGGNEANFFVRDVTGGSRLPFRIRPGAPTSSIDISATGNVGVGTASPQGKLHLQNAGQLITAWGDTSGTVGNKVGRVVYDGGNVVTGGGWVFQKATDAGLFSANLFTIVQNTGNVGIGTITPAAQFHTTAGVRFAGITNCAAGIASNAAGDLSCVASSRQFKNITGGLDPQVALANVMALRPQTGSYKVTPDEPEHWLIAEDVAAVDPALAGLNEGKPYTVKTQNVVADLVAVVQQQQRRIDELERRLTRK